MLLFQGSIKMAFSFHFFILFPAEIRIVELFIMVGSIIVIDNIISPLNLHLSLKHVILTCQFNRLNSSGSDLVENFVQSVFICL